MSSPHGSRDRRTGLLLANLGSPDSPSPSDVRRYLREFLSDPRVIDIAPWKRALILNLFILPFRPRRSGEAYASIWTERGSPLLIHTRALAEKVARLAGDRVVVDWAMRYGSPSIPEVLDRLVAGGVDRIVVFPLYPQYSSATTGSTAEAVYRWASHRWNVPPIQILGPFYDHPAYLDAFVETTRPLVDPTVERVYFSFHGLPERHVRKGDRTGAHCLQRSDCCRAIGPANAECYRAQCFETARRLAERLGLESERWRVCFQSRLGREPWIRPYTDRTLVEDAEGGCRRAVIVSPAFVADCLETLEELGMQAVDSWSRHGGESLRLAECPNASDAWAEGVTRIAREASEWLRPVGGATALQRSDRD